jgi:hypothetical protein
MMKNFGYSMKKVKIEGEEEVSSVAPLARMPSNKAETPL